MAVTHQAYQFLTSYKGGGAALNHQNSKRVILLMDCSRRNAGARKQGGKPVIRHAFTAFEEASFLAGKCLNAL